MEGVVCTGLSGCTCPSADLTGPFKQWNHSQARAITGGMVYRGIAIPDLDGTYFYGDYSFSRLWSIKEEGGAVVPGSDIDREAELETGGGNIGTPTNFGPDGNGEILITDHNNSNGEVWRIIPAGPFRGLGGQIVGANGKPKLYGTGDTGIGQPGSLHLRDAPGNPSLAILFLSFEDNPAPFKGGTLHTLPIIGQFALIPDATGSLDIPWADLGAPGPFSLYWQWAFDDPSAVFGVSMSNALQMDIP